MTTKELKVYFWDVGNLITSDDGVEIEYFAEDIVMVSVTLRNHETYCDRYQLRTAFDDLLQFMRAFDIGAPEDLQFISVPDLLELYKKDMVDVDHFEYPID